MLRVGSGSAAERAGLRGASVSRDGQVMPGDVIVAIEGKPIESVARLSARLDDFKIGETVTLEVLRDGQTRKVAVALQPGN